MLRTLCLHQDIRTLKKAHQEKLNEYNKAEKLKRDAAEKKRREEQKKKQEDRLIGTVKPKQRNDIIESASTG